MDEPFRDIPKNYRSWCRYELTRFILPNFEWFCYNQNKCIAGKYLNIYNDASWNDSYQLPQNLMIKLDISIMTAFLKIHTHWKYFHQQSYEVIRKLKKIRHNGILKLEKIRKKLKLRFFLNLADEDCFQVEKL